MLYAFWKCFCRRNFHRQIPEYLQLASQVSMNGTAENVGGEQCKREHAGDVEEPSKKLCTNADNVVENKNVGKKKKNHKYAMLLSYNGGNYYGMQFNKNYKTVESELFKAFNKVGIMSSSDVTPYLIKFQRAARTDKNVSAARQIVSLMMSEGVCMPEDLNAHLPSDIRVFSFKRTTKHFNSKGNCTARTYSYLLPTHIFSQEPLSAFLESDYRITPDLIEKINELLKLFIGSHNFHNYTSKINALDPRARRYIMSFSCEEPFVRTKEFIMLTVRGQSFILHQIRKMVGAVVAVMKGIGTADSINASFLKERIRIPLAPGDGLFLEKPHFDKYNKRFGNDGIHEMLTWDEVEEDVLKFRQEKIINPITDGELEKKVIIEWVGYLLENPNKYFQPFKNNDNEAAAENAEDDEEGEDEDADGDVNESEKDNALVL